MLSIVPAGTGNDVARNLAISIDPIQAAAFDPARIRQVDVGRVTFGSDQVDHRWVLNSLSVGTSARANRIALSLGRAIRGPAKYPIAGVLALLSGGARRYEVLVDGQRRFQGKAINLTVANGGCFGGGLRISPDSSPDDGVLDLVIIGDLARGRALRALRALRSGTHVTMPDVQVLPAIAAPIEIDSPGPLPFETDGENLVSHDRVIVNLVPGRLKVAR
jgi:diacylglycerol kinase (ATP)